MSIVCCCGSISGISRLVRWRLSTHGHRVAFDFEILVADAIDGAARAPTSVRSSSSSSSVARRSPGANVAALALAQKVVGAGGAARDQQQHDHDGSNRSAAGASRVSRRFCRRRGRAHTFRRSTTSAASWRPSPCSRQWAAAARRSAAAESAPTCRLVCKSDLKCLHQTQKQKQNTPRARFTRNLCT